MKNIMLFIAIICWSSIQINAQIETPNRAGVLGFEEQSIGLVTGMDYSILPLSLSYEKAVKIFNYKFPLAIGAEITVPMFSMDFEDVRVKILTETTLLRKNNFEIRGGINPIFINTKMETETMTSLGTDFHLFIGKTSEKWNTGIEMTYNQIFSTNIKHTDKYRENVFEQAVDGWYKNTAANIRLGILVNRRINKVDLFFGAGLSKTSQFKDYLFVPTYYANLGINYRF